MGKHKQIKRFFDVMVDTINKWLEDYVSKIEPHLYISSVKESKIYDGEYKGNGCVCYSAANVVTRVEWILDYKSTKEEYGRLILSRSVFYSGKVIWYLTQGSSLNTQCLLIEENKIHMYDKTGDFPIFIKDSIMDLMGRLEDALFFESYVRSFDSSEHIPGGKDNNYPGSTKIDFDKSQLISQKTLKDIIRKWLISLPVHDGCQILQYGGMKGLFSWTLPHATGENGKGIYARLCEDSLGVFWKIYQDDDIQYECIRITSKCVFIFSKSGNFNTFSIDEIEKLRGMIVCEIIKNHQQVYFSNHYNERISKTEEEKTTTSNNNEEIKTKEMSEDMRYLTQPTRVFRPTLAGLCIHVHAPNLDVIKHTKIRKSLNLHDDFNKGLDEYSFNGVITAVQSNGFTIEGHHAYGFFTINIQDVISGLIQLRLLSPANEDDIKLVNDIDDEYRA